MGFLHRHIECDIGSRGSIRGASFGGGNFRAVSGNGSLFVVFFIAVFPVCGVGLSLMMATGMDPYMLVYGIFFCVVYRQWCPLVHILLLGMGWSRCHGRIQFPLCHR